jgi:hypothetical protein
MADCKGSNKDHKQKQVDQQKQVGLFTCKLCIACKVEIGLLPMATQQQQQQQQRKQQ